jgi:hypothetical protein
MRLPVLLAWAFLACTLVTGTGLIWLMPIGEVSDEPEHIARADGLLSGQILGQMTPNGGMSGVMADDAVLDIITKETLPTFPTKPLPAAALQAARARGWSPKQDFCFTQMIEYFPALYAPGALGLGLGRLCGLSPFASLLLGRAFMLLAFAGLGFMALRLARCGHALLFAVLTLPMTQSLAASFNQDGLLIAAATLACALLTRPPNEPPRLWLVAWAALTLVATAKPAYDPLLLAALLPLGAPGWRQRALVVLGGMLAPVVWVVVMLRTSFTNWYRPPYHPGPLWPGDPGIMLHGASSRDNLLVLLAHPAEAIALPAKLLLTDGGRLAHEMVGVLGWKFIWLPGWAYPAWGVALACAALTAGGTAWRGRDSALAGLAVTGGFLGVTLALYISYTNVGLDYIDGVNGRYFLPFLAFLPLILPRLGARLGAKRADRLQALAALPALLMAASGAYLLPALIEHIYQMPLPW